MTSPRPATSSLAALFQQHAAFVWRVLKRHGVAERELQDAVQEVFLIVHRRLDTFEGRSQITSWLYAIAMRVASQQRRRAHLKHEILDGEVPEHSDDARGALSLERSTLLERLDDALMDLSEEHRGAFILYEIEELTMAEVAAAQGCPVSTAASRVYAARQKLERALSGEERT